MRALFAAVLSLSALTVPLTVDAHTATARCPQHEHRFVRHAPPGGWNIALMSYICFKESRGLNVRSRTGDTGILQINDINLPYLSRTLGVNVTQEWLMRPGNNVRAAAALCAYWRYATGNCYQPWNMRPSNG